MDMNYAAVALIIFLTIVIIVVLIYRNKKDQKNFEEKVNQSELQPEEHKEGEV